MNRHQVTISALGTTGVLLAASLTMLALVSALVGFDAWPQRAGGESPSDVAVQHAPAARLVRAVQPSPAALAAARARAARALAAASLANGSGSTGTSTVTAPAPSFTAAPTPRVPHNPPGAGPGGPLVSVGGPGRRPNRPVSGPSPSPVHAVTCGASATVSGINPGAAGPLVTACKGTPPASATAE